MRRSLTRSFAAALVTLLAIAAIAQELTVTHNVNLRPDPSANNPAIRLVLVGEQLTLLDPNKTADYWHVATAQNEQGWVYSHNVHASTPTPSPTPSSGGAADVVDPGWDKPAPVEITFNTSKGPCGPDGDPTGDTATNHLKNRVDAPGAPHEVTFDAMVKLPKLPAGSPISRSSPNWPNVAPQIAPLEGAAVSVEGFIVKVKTETGEKTNCGCTNAAEIDWHLPLVKAAADPENLSVVVELTPRVRRAHPNWTQANLAPASGPKPKFRVSGWLMYDPDHPGHLFDPANPKPKRYRLTLWEVHPVTKIEVLKAGAWVDLDGP